MAVSLAAAVGSHLVASPISPDNLIDKFGVPGLLIIIFAECGLLIGFFLPGDTLLFSTGLLIATNKIHAPLALVLVLLPIAALIGNACGYWIGRQPGRASSSGRTRASSAPNSSSDRKPSSTAGARSRSSSDDSYRSSARSSPSWPGSAG